MKSLLKQDQYYPRPFVKWAGGKRQLISEISRHIPFDFDSYFEPFVGGGALFFYLISKYPKLKCYISDLNYDLILTYLVVRDNVNELISSLENHAEKFSTDSNSYYYFVRETHPNDKVARASRFIFLNRTCFNGLFRVNREGKFNVPFGKYTNPNIVNRENLLSVSKVLQLENVVIHCCDFENALNKTHENDFVYLDPPYYPLTKTSSFTSYTHSEFDYNEQKRLAKQIKVLNTKKCKVILSNSSSETVSHLFSNCFRNVIEVNANRSINSQGEGRTGHVEFIFINY